MRAKTCGKARPINPKGRKNMEASLDESLKLNLIRVPLTFDFSCLAFLVNKHSEMKHGKKIMVIIYIPLNAIIVKFRHLMSHKNTLLTQLIGPRGSHKFDFNNGFR
jgi:hypothetical protein